MKKYLFIGLLGLMVTGFNACTYYTNPPSGGNDTIYIGDDCKFHKQTFDLNAEQSSWQFDNLSNAYFCHFDVPQLTWDVYNYGEVSVNREYNTGTQNAYQVALPETSYKVEEVDDGNGNINTFYYAQHVDYIYGAGYVEIFYTISDYFYPDDFVPEAMRFRLQLTY